MSQRSLIRLVAPVLCFTFIAACGSSSPAPKADASGGAGSAAGAGGGAAGADGGAAGSTAGAGGGTAGAGGGTAGAGGGTAGTSGSDAGAGAGGSPVDGATDVGVDAGVDAGTCPMIANVATTILDTAMLTTAVPVGTGGAISDGTYTMTALINYQSSASGKAHSYTFNIAGTLFALTGHDKTDPDQSAGFTMTANPLTGALAIVGFCPASVVGQHLGNLDSYTATATVIHAYSSSKNQEIVLTKQ